MFSQQCVSVGQIFGDACYIKTEVPVELAKGSLNNSLRTISHPLRRGVSLDLELGGDLLLTSLSRSCFDPEIPIP